MVLNNFQIMRLVVGGANLFLLLFLSFFIAGFSQEVQRDVGVYDHLDEERAQEFTKEIFEVMWYGLKPGMMEEFSEAERIHMAEVHEVYQVFLGVFLACSIVSSLSHVFLSRREPLKSTKNKKSFSHTPCFSAVFVLFLVLFVIWFFDVAFILFHELLFEKPWQFAPDALLLQLFPKAFFEEVTRNILLSWLALIGVFFLLRLRLRSGFQAFRMPTRST